MGSQWMNSQFVCAADPPSKHAKVFNDPTFADVTIQIDIKTQRFEEQQHHPHAENTPPLLPPEASPAPEAACLESVHRHFSLADVCVSPPRNQGATTLAMITGLLINTKWSAAAISILPDQHITTTTHSHDTAHHTITNI